MTFGNPVTRSLRDFAVLILTLVVGIFLPSAAQADAPRKPNIVFVLLDNLGWGELGVYGGGSLRGAPTPRMDALANEGLRLTNFNVETSCTPTRSALMTGRFSVRSGNLRSGASGLVRWEVTIAQLLKHQGYATAHFGKWHLGDEPGRYPNNFGFDEWYGIPRTSGESLNRTSPGYDPGVTAPEYIMQGNTGAPSTRVKEYTMAARREIDGDLIDKTIGFMSDNVAAKRPFFAYVPMTQVHYPTIPSAAFAGKSGFGDFADSVMQTDFLVGKLLDAIDRMGIDKDTIIIVASDNGPEYRRPWRGTAGPWTGTYHTLFEGGLRAPFMIRWTGRIAPSVSDDIVHAVDVFNTLADAGGAPVPVDRPIDGVDQLPFFLGKTRHSARDSFPFYDEGDLFGVKYRDWKYYTLWKADADAKPAKLAHPYLFNITVDPKEESPRESRQDRTADSWVDAPIDAVLATMAGSLKANPPIPFQAPLDFVPAPMRKN